jgi:molybdopterin/thiamine biosynthesis adenylyltransferase
MAHLVQVGAGSGGMPVLDMLCRDVRITRVTLIEPDLYKPHNVERHLFSISGVGEPKAELAEAWLKERRPDLEVRLFECDLLDPAMQGAIEEAIAAADIGVCGADNEAAKYHWDALMRKHGKPWTLGEVLSGGIGGFVHWFVPEGPCYGCVASRLNRDAPAEKSPVPDYSQPNGAIAETTVPAGVSSIHAIASLHALLTLQLLDFCEPHAESKLKTQDSKLKTQNSELTDRLGFTSLLLSLQKVPDVFEEAFRPYRFRVARSADCLICRPRPTPSSSEDLDVALDQALARLGDE